MNGRIVIENTNVVSVFSEPSPGTPGEGGVRAGAGRPSKHHGTAARATPMWAGICGMGGPTSSRTGRRWSGTMS